jgi:hypothetical protein
VNDLKDALNVCEHVVIPEAQNAIALSFKEICARGIGCRSRRVLAAIDFDDNAGCVVCRINDVAAE